LLLLCMLLRFCRAPRARLSAVLVFLPCSSLRLVLKRFLYSIQGISGWCEEAHGTVAWQATQASVSSPLACAPSPRPLLVLLVECLLLVLLVKCLLSSQFCSTLLISPRRLP